MTRPLFSCSLDDCLLRLLRSEPATGYDMAKTIPGRDLPIATLYGTLHRLERRGLLQSEWRAPSDRGFCARYYHLTPRGVRRIEPPVARGGVHVTLNPLTLLLVMVAAGGADGAASPRHFAPHLTIPVDLQTSMPFDEVRLMQMGVDRIMGAIGVAIDWRIETERSTRESRASSLASDFVIRVVVMRRAPELSSDEWLLGFTPTAQNGSPFRVLVFRDAIVDFAAAHFMEPSAVQALVVAHELGHVLLPEPAHGTVGIMQAPWDARTVEQARDQTLKFTAVQGQLVRQRLTLCCQVASKN
jgi:hypothetical protein